MGTPCHLASRRVRDLPVGADFGDQRDHHFGGGACDRYAAAQRRISFSWSSGRIRFFIYRNSATPPWITPSRLPRSISASFDQCCRNDSEDPEVLRYQSDRRFILPGVGNDVAAELQGRCFRHAEQPLVEINIGTNEEFMKLTAVPNQGAGNSRAHVDLKLMAE